MTDNKRNADVSKTLTEQWKKGELQSGWYWVELKEGTFAEGKKSIILNYLFEFTNDFERHPYLVEQVLAPVPGYGKYQKLLSDQLAKNEGEEINAELMQKIHILNEANMKLENEVGKFGEENAKLKELLKECKLAIFDYPPYDLASDKIRLQIKINQVLGEE